MENERHFQLECPTPTSGSDTILLAHGGGGRLMQSLIHRVFHERFDNLHLRREHVAVGQNSRRVFSDRIPLSLSWVVVVDRCARMPGGVSHLLLDLLIKNRAC